MGHLWGLTASDVRVGVGFEADESHFIALAVAAMLLTFWSPNSRRHDMTLVSIRRAWGTQKNGENAPWTRLNRVQSRRNHQGTG